MIQRRRLSSPKVDEGWGTITYLVSKSFPFGGEPLCNSLELKVSKLLVNGKKIKWLGYGFDLIDAGLNYSAPYIALVYLKTNNLGEAFNYLAFDDYLDNYVIIDSDIDYTYTDFCFFNFDCTMILTCPKPRFVGNHSPNINGQIYVIESEYYYYAVDDYWKNKVKSITFDEIYEIVSNFKTKYNLQNIETDYD